LENHSQSYTKKELLKFQNTAEKLNKSIGGIKVLNSKPDLLFIIDTNKEFLAVKEANKSEIPIVAILDSNSNPEGIDYPIPGNDDAIRSIEFYCNAIAETINENKINNQSLKNESET
jgi:small subunit ribosomal protein S2